MKLYNTEIEEEKPLKHSKKQAEKEKKQARKAEKQARKAENQARKAEKQAKEAKESAKKHEVKIVKELKPQKEKFKPGKKIIVAIVVAAAVLISGTAVFFINNDDSDTVAYKEVTVQYGNVIKGVTESGSIDIGVTTETFDLDMSALQRTDSSSSESSGSSAGGGMPGAAGALDMFSDLFSLNQSGSSSSGSASTITVSEVCVSVGEEVSAGDTLYLIDEESVADLKEELESNVEKAKADLDALIAEQTLSTTKATYTYNSSIAYGDYLDTEYNSTIEELSDAVDTAKENLEDAKESLTTYEEKYAEMADAVAKAKEVYSNVEYSLSTHSVTDDVYWYVYYATEYETAKENYESLESQLEELEEKVSQAEENVTTAENNYAKAVRELEAGKLTATETKSLRSLAYDTAQESYDLTIAYLERDLEDQQEVYDEALEKWNEFSSYINGNAICATDDGVITSVELSEGDTISTGTTLVTLTNPDEVTMTVTVYEDDMTDISLGSEAVVSLTAYPDEAFEGTVTEIGEATLNSSNKVTYEVTVTLSGDVSGLYQEMTGTMTFVSERAENVLYVNKRAIITEGDTSYVEVKESNGSISKKKVTVGISDGTYTEISGDINEGDVVLIERSAS